MIIVSLIVFVPLISSMNTVEVLFLPRSVLVMPPVHLPAIPPNFMCLAKNVNMI